MRGVIVQNPRVALEQLGVVVESARAQGAGEAILENAFLRMPEGSRDLAAFELLKLLAGNEKGSRVTVTVFA